MLLRNFLSARRVHLDLAGDSRDEILGALVGLFHLDERDRASLLRALRRREALGSTGIGRGIAVPHCRSLAVRRLQLAYGRRPGGIEFGATDQLPVSHFFLIVAPPDEVSGQYLPVLGTVARFVRDPATRKRLEGLNTAEEFLTLLEARGM